MSALSQTVSEQKRDAIKARKTLLDTGIFAEEVGYSTWVLKLTRSVYRFHIIRKVWTKNRYFMADFGEAFDDADEETKAVLIWHLDILK